VLSGPKQKAGWQPQAVPVKAHAKSQPLNA
jgi:hypothetical protein